MCDQTMSLDRFSKAQRRKTDDAVSTAKSVMHLHLTGLQHCLHCQQEKSDREADYDKEVEEVNIMDDYKKRVSAATVHVLVRYLTEQQLGGSASYYSSIASATHRSRSAQSQSDQYETDTNPGSPSWAHGNDAVSLAGTETSRPSSTSNRIVTGTGWDGFAGDGRSTTARSVTSGRSNNPGFVKQNAVRKDVHQKVAEQLAREHERHQQEKEQVVRDESDDDSEASDDPY